MRCAAACRVDPAGFYRTVFVLTSHKLSHLSKHKCSIQRAVIYEKAKPALSYVYYPARCSSTAACWLNEPDIKHCTTD